MIDTDSAADPRHREWRKMYDQAAQEEEVPPPPPEVNIWQIGAGSAIMIAGVVVPVLAITIGAIYSFEGLWRLTILHPIETLIEMLLVLAVPYANLSAWHSICHNDLRHPVRTGLLNGIAITVPAITLAVSAASFALHYPLIDSVNKQPHDLSIGLMGVMSIPALCSALFLTHALRNAKHTRDAKLRTILYSLMGIALTIFSFLGAEARSTFIRIAENMSLSDDAKERETGLSMLRNSGPEKELKITCADPHAAGLAGMFLPLNVDAQKRLFFAATGKPYRAEGGTDMSLMSNDYLRDHVVGNPVEGLSLHRSAIFGQVHPKTLTSTLDWTFVFKNKTYMNQEARAELALPEGAVISNLTLWINGQARPGAFSATENASGSYKWVTTQHRDPALITDLGRGRYLLQAAPIQGQGEMKVQVSITEPLKLDGNNVATLGMPHFIDENFKLNGQHQITIRSDSKLTSPSLPSLKPSFTADGTQVISGKLNQADISTAAFTVKLDQPVEFKPIAVFDNFAHNGVIIEELKTRSTSAPKHLVVVVDSSQAMKEHLDKIVTSLDKIDKNIKTSIMLAGDSEAGEVYPLKDGLKKLKENNFGGGQDNLFALVKASELAGESSGGAVLWIHGPQPGYNNEIYIMSPYAHTPSFFEMALDDCLTNTNEFFKNHHDVGPFAAVPRTGPLSDDLDSFLSKWQPGAKETYTDLSILKGGTTAEIVKDADCAREVAILHAARQIKDLLASGRISEAVTQAVRYHIVTPVSAAVVLENAEDYKQWGMEVPKNTPSAAEQNAMSPAPMLQGATNGTVGPQGSDATVIMGVNTAGTVRVNNLANLEALLNILANLAEVLGLAIGGVNLALGAMGKTMEFPFKVSARGRIIYGVCVAALGLMVPGMINWLVASARDANLFS